MATIPEAPEERNYDAPISDLTWGGKGAPLLPASLRARWHGEALPGWVSRELNLPAGATMEALGRGVVPRAGISDRVKNYLSLLLNSRSSAVRSVVIVDRAWPAHLQADRVPWRQRTRNGLRSSGLLERLRELPRITFADLFDVPGMGAVSVLDFACTLEAVLDLLSEDQNSSPDDRKLAAISNTLLDVLDEPWADQVSEKDPRFADLLPPGTGTLVARIDALTASPEVSVWELEALATTVTEVRSRIRELERLPLEDALRDYIGRLFGLQDRRLAGMLARLHLDGSATASTQDEAGALAGGITRQRVQQLEVRGMRRRPSHPVVMPQLDRALSVLLHRSPIEISPASELLVDEGISRAPFHPASVMAAARFCGRTPAIEIRRVYHSDFVVALAPDGDVIDRVIQMARRQAEQAGASNISQVAESLLRESIEISEERVAELLRSYASADFLSEEWFCFPLSSSAVRQISRKMLSVTTPLSVAALREGIKRQFQFRRSSRRSKSHLPAPPRDILARYFKVHPDFVINDNGEVRSVTPLHYDSELSGVERVMVTVLRAAPSRVLDRTAFADACEERGVNTNTLWTLATYSPVIERIGSGLWTLCGTVVDPAIIEAFRKENALRPRERRILDYGWLPSGELWVGIRLPAHSERFSLTLPSAVARFITGRHFVAQDSDGTPCGTIHIYEGNRAGGIQPFLRRAGADEDDVLLIRFDLPAGTAALRIIDDEALEELSPEV